MKTIYIVRHAKSSWDHLALSDHERPLMKIGVQKTERIANYLKKNDIVPDLFVSSSAVRAKETALIIAKMVDYPVDKILIDKQLYHADSDIIYSTFFGLEDHVDSVMLFGHNPTLTYFVNQFLDNKIDNLPTSGMVSVSFETEKWEKIAQAKFRVNFVIFPKMLKI